MRTLLGSTLAGVLIMSAALLFNQAYSRDQKIAYNDNSIVRLHTKEGRFFCSGVVISQTQIATAAHCVVSESPLGLYIDFDQEIEIRAADGLPTGIYAHILGANPNFDTAILKGSFSKFSIRAMVQEPLELDRIMMDPESAIVACGYPMGGKLICTKVTKVRRSFFFYAAKGVLYPGMSGGPVIDLHSGRVLALNRAVDDNEIIVNPLAEFLTYILPQG